MTLGRCGDRVQLASMRPSGITDGIRRERAGGVRAGIAASMRPSGITDGILLSLIISSEFSASMRPSGITDGIIRQVSGVADPVSLGQHRASMRPSGITDGISHGRRARWPPHASGFNEAVGYYRRNHEHWEVLAENQLASMRPSGITDGINPGRPRSAS